MKRLFFRIRNLALLSLLVMFLAASVAPHLEPASADELPSVPQAAVAEVDAPEANPDPARPEGQGGVDISCALFLTPVAFLDQGSGAGVDFPDQVLNAVHGQFHDDGFFDIGVPRPEGQQLEVSVGDEIVIYALLTNGVNRVSPSGDCAQALDGNQVTIDVTGIDVFLSRTSGMGENELIGDAIAAVDWPLDGEENVGILPPDEQVFTLFNWEVPAEFNGNLLDEFLFAVQATGTCTEADAGLAICQEGAGSRLQRYPDPDNQTLDGTQFDIFYNGEDNGVPPLLDIVGPRADVEVTVATAGNPPTESNIVVAPFTDVTYTIEITSRGADVDAIRSIDDGDGEGGGALSQCDISSANWRFDDVNGAQADAGDINGGAGLGLDEVIVCTFTETISPAQTDDDDNFTLRGVLRLFNQVASGGLDTPVEIVAPSVLVTEASIDIVKQIIDPDSGDPVAPGTEFAVGDTITYRITVTNTGQNDLENLLVVDSLTGPVSGFGGVLTVDGDDETKSTEIDYVVTAEDARPLINTVSVTANPVGAPLSFQVSDSGAATATIAEDNFSVRLILSQVQQEGGSPVPFDTGNPATFPRPGATLFYQIEYCNLGQINYRDMRFINNTPTFTDTSRTFVDVNLGDGIFGPGCYTTPGTAFEYTVPQPLDVDNEPNPGYVDPVINTIDVRATTQGGSFLFAEDTVSTNVVNENIEISAARYSILTGADLNESDAVLRGDTLYYHVDLVNNSTTCVQNIRIRNYLRDGSGQLIPGSPFEIPYAAIDWGSGFEGRLEADGGGPENAATSRSVPGGNRITFTVTGDTPDPINRVFEVFADTDCNGNPLTEPFLDRANVFTDISDIQLNTLIQVFNASAIDDGVLDEDALDFGLLLDASEYIFTFDATNVGSTFDISSLTYCVLPQPNSQCDERPFPNDVPAPPFEDARFFDPDTDSSFLPFENRSDISAPIDVIANPEGDEEAFSTRMQIQVILRGEEEGNDVVVRTLFNFLLLSEDLVGEIRADENNDGSPDNAIELVRGDGPVPIQYNFLNATGGTVNDLQVFNLTEVGTGAGFGTVPLAGFDDGTQYELCNVPQTTLLADNTLSGICNFTYRSYLPAGEFDIEVLVVGRRAVDNVTVFGFDSLTVTEIEHLEVEKTSPSGTISAGQEATFTIEVTNNSRYQRLDFGAGDGLIDELSAPLDPGSDPLPTIDRFLADNPPDIVSSNGFGGVILEPATPDGPTVMVLTFTIDPDTTDLTSLTNTATVTATTIAPDPPPAAGEVETGLIVSATSEVTVNFACPITLEGIYGRFVTDDIGSDPILFPPGADPPIDPALADVWIQRHNNLLFSNTSFESENFPAAFLPTPTTGEGQTVVLYYPNESGDPIFVDGLTDELWTLENQGIDGRPATVYQDIIWPEGNPPGYLLPGEAMIVVLDFWLRPDFLTDGLSLQIYEWDVEISLQEGFLPQGFDEPSVVPPGCETFSLFWFFNYDHPIQVAKGRIGDGQLVPGDEIEYGVDFAVVTEYHDHFIQRVDDPLLSTNLDFIRDDGAGPGRLNPGESGRILGQTQDGNPQNIYTVQAEDTASGIENIASVTGYIPIDFAEYPPSWERDGVASVIGQNNPVIGEALNEILPTTPLVIELEAGAEEVTAGGQFDINVSLANTSSALSIDGVTAISVDQEFIEGLSVASGGATEGTLSLQPTSAVNYTITEPFYTVPFDYTEESLEICASATGTLSDEESTQVAAIESCIEITIVPPDLSVTKQVYLNRNGEGFCTNLAPIANLPEPGSDADPPEPTDRVFTVNALQTIYFGFEISNASASDTFTVNSFEDIVGDSASTDLSAALEADFLAKTGDNRDIAPGQSVIPCVAYQVPADAVSLPSLVNEVSLNVSIGETEFLVTDDVAMEVEDPNVTISKGTNQNIGFPGDTVIYTVTIRNRNPDGASLLIDEFYDTLISPRLNDVSYIDTCLEAFDPGGAAPNNNLSTSESCDPSVTSVPLDFEGDGANDGWTWPTEVVGLIPPDTAATLRYEYEVQPADPDPLINQTGVRGKLYDENWVAVQDNGGENDLIAQDATQAGIAITNSQLVVRKESIRGAVSAGTPADYNIVVTNIGETPVTNIQVIDCYPTVATPCNLEEPPYTEDGLPNPAFGGEVLTADLLPESAAQTLQPQASVRISRNTIQLPTSEDVAADLDLDPFINTVYVTGLVVIDEDSGETVPVVTATDSAIVDILIPGIQVIKSTEAATYSVGEQVTYDISITNTGEQPLTIISAQDILPGDAGNPIDLDDFTDCESGASFTIGSTGDQLAPEAAICTTVTVTVPIPPAGESEFINTVRVTAEAGGVQIIDSASAAVDVRSTGLAVTKSAFATEAEAQTETPGETPLIGVQDGDDVWYRIKIVNGGTIPLTEIRVSDTNAAFNSGDTLVITDFTVYDIENDNGDNILDPGESFILVYRYQANFDDAGPLGDLVNTVTIVGVELAEEGEDPQLTDTRNASYTINIEEVSLDVTKVACREVTEGVQPSFPDCVQPETFAQPGDTIWYQIVLENPSRRDIDAIAAVDSRDDAALQAEFVNADNWDGNIAGRLNACAAPPCPQAVFTYEGTNPVPSGQPSITNTVTVTANNASDSEASATVTIVAGELLVTIVETQGRNDAPTGTELTFDLTVTNLSATETLQDVSVVVPLINPTSIALAPIAPGNTATTQVTYTVGAEDTALNFVVQAEATLGTSNLTINDSDTWSFTRSVPGFAASKIADVTTAIIGDTITYTITVENTSDGSIEVQNLSVVDSLLPVVAQTFTDTTLSPGERVQEQFTYEVQGNEGNPIVNELLVTGSFEGQGFTVQDSWEVFVPNGEILVTNTVSRDSINVGESVTFTYEVCNLGDTTMTNVALSDDDGALDLGGVTQLEPDTCANAFRQVTATVNDVPELSRTVTGSGDVGGQALSQAVTRTVEVLDTSGAGDLRFEINANPENAVEIGGQLDLTFVIRNVGSVAFTVDSFDGGDDLFTGYSPNPVGQTVSPGESLTFSGVPASISVTVDTPDPIADTWTVTVTDTNDNEFSLTDSISIPVVEDADVALILSAVGDTDEVLPGGTVTYTYTVRNNSAAMQTAVLQDRANECAIFTPGANDLWADTGATIMPGATATATATCTVSESATGDTISHTVDVFAITDLVNAVDTSVVTTSIASAFGELEVEILEAQPSILQVGSDVNFVYRLSNPSTSATVTNITLTADPSCDEEDRVYRDAETEGQTVSFDGTLAPQAEIFVFCEYTPVEADFDTLTVEATATAEGIDSVTDTRQFTVIDADFSVDFRAQTGANGVTQVTGGQTVAFTVTLTNIGESPLTLPPFDEDSPAISSSVTSATQGFTPGSLGSNEGLYNLFDDTCNFPLQAGQSCTVTGDADAGGIMTYTVPAENPPATMTVSFNVMLQEVETDFDVPMVTRQWQLQTSTPGQASMLFVNFAVSPTTGINVGDTVLISAGLQNNGSAVIDLQSVTLAIRESTAQANAATGDDGIRLTSAPRQDFADDGICLAPTPVQLTNAGAPVTLPFSFQPGTTLGVTYSYALTADPDCAQGVEFVLRASGEADAEITVTQEQVFRLADNVDPFDQIGGGGDQQLDPNALDPTVTKTVSPETIFPGESGTFTIIVTNPSTSQMEINLIDPIAAAFTVDSASSTLGTAAIDALAEVPGVEVSVLGVTLEPGASMTVTINFTVGAEIEIPSLITNTACAANGTRPEVCASVEVPVGGTADGTLPTTGIGSLEPVILDEAVGHGLPVESVDLVAPIQRR